MASHPLLRFLWVLLFLGKDCRAHPHVIAAVGNGNGVVVAHSGRKDRKVLVGGEMVLLYCAEKLLYCCKFAVYLCLVGGVAGHTHEAAYLHVCEASPLATGKHRKALLWGEAEFCLLLCNVNLQQAGDAAACLCALLVNFGKELVAVDAVDEVHKGCNIFYFIALQVSYEMPADVGGQGLLFLGEVLCLTFPKMALAGVVCGLYSLYRVVFGHSYERNPRGEGCAHGCNSLGNGVRGWAHNGKYPQLNFRSPMQGRMSLQNPPYAC